MEERIKFEIETYELRNQELDTELSRLHEELQAVAAAELNGFNIGLLEGIIARLKRSTEEKTQNIEFIRCLKNLTR